MNQRLGKLRRRQIEAAEQEVIEHLKESGFDETFLRELYAIATERDDQELSVGKRGGE